MHLGDVYNLCKASRLVLSNVTLKADQCLANMDPTSNGPCIICPNTDLAGIGVRIAFYAQTFLNTLVVILSPTDAAVSAWAGTILTAALVIAALVQKARQSITLHHALLTQLCDFIMH